MPIEIVRNDITKMKAGRELFVKRMIRFLYN